MDKRNALLTAAAMTVLAGCATPPPPPSVASARQAVQAARADATVNADAPAALNDAERNLADAERAAKAGNPDYADHFARMAQLNVDLARAQTREQSAIAARQNLAQQAPQIELSARNRSSGGGQTIATLDLPFETGSATLRPGASARLDPVVSALQKQPNEQVTVRGFTDNLGSEETNQRLSQQRAEAVRAYLISRGIPADKVIAQGLGESLPIASNNTAAGRARNRRVEIQVSQVPE